MAAFNKPLASYVVDGTTTLMPGLWKNQASGLLEWNGPPFVPPPEGQRITIGTGIPTRQYILEAILIIWSKPQVIKSINCISAIGRMPIITEPTADPIIAASDMGVSITRSGPNSASKPA